MTCKTHNEFLNLLETSEIKPNNGKCLKEVYDEYLKKMEGAFPIKNFVTDEFGLEVISSPLDLNISGMLEGNKITVNSSNVPARQNFTIAHEFAHYILKHGNQVDYRANRNYSPEQILQEEQADCFAACLLMPEHIVREEVEKFKKQKNIESLANNAPEIIHNLSNRFNVSTAAVIMRLKALYYITGWIWV